MKKIFLLLSLVILSFLAASCAEQEPAEKALLSKLAKL
jgi:hypothetical protein